MKQFLAIYTGSPDSVSMKKWSTLTEAEQKARTQEGGMAWQAWGKKYEKAIVGFGGPLGKTKKVDGSGVSDIRNAMSAYTIVQAESHEEAAKMFLKHPHFAIFPGDAVEIMECMPIPKF